MANLKKEILERTASIRSSASSKDKRRKLGKTFRKSVMFLVFIAEVTKLLIISQKEENIDYSIIGLLACTALFAVYLILGTCIDAKTKMHKLVRREIFLILCFSLFMFFVQDAYFQQPEDTADNLSSTLYWTSTAAIPLIFTLIGDILSIHYVSKLLVNMFYYIHIIIRSFIQNSEQGYLIMLEVMLPCIYTGLFIVMRDIFPYKKKVAKVEGKIDDIIPLLKDTIFGVDKSGKLTQINDFCIGNLGNLGEIVPGILFSKIVNIVFVKEKVQKKKPGQEDCDNIIDNEYSIHEEMEKSQAANFNSVLKFIQNSLEKEVGKFRRLITYKGKIYDDNNIEYTLEIRVAVRISKHFPITILMRDISKHERCEILSENEKNREAVLTRIHSEIRDILDVSAKFINHFSSEKKFETLKKTLVEPLVSTYHLLCYLTDDIIDFTNQKLHRLKFTFTQVDIGEIIKELVNFFQLSAKMKNIQIVTKFEQQVDLILSTDAKRVKQILLRLISNAIKYTKEGEIRILVHSYNNALKIAVEDTGEGISKELLEKINESFKAPNALHGKKSAIRSKDAPYNSLNFCNYLAKRLGPHSFSGLQIKSEKGTKVWFILENKYYQEDEEKLSRSNTIQSPSTRKCHTPTKPSRFKMTHDYESYDLSSSEDDGFGAKIQEDGNDYNFAFFLRRMQSNVGSNPRSEFVKKQSMSQNSNDSNKRYSTDVNRSTKNLFILTKNTALLEAISKVFMETILIMQSTTLFNLKSQVKANRNPGQNYLLIDVDCLLKFNEDDYQSLLEMKEKYKFQVNGIKNGDLENHIKKMNNTRLQILKETYTVLNCDKIEDIIESCCKD